MPPYQYPSVAPNPYAMSIGELLLHGGDIQAQRALAVGNAWAGAARNIGQDVSGTIQQLNDPRQQLARQQVETNDQVKQYNGVVNQILAQFAEPAPDGSVTVNIGKVQAAMAQAKVPLHLQGPIIENASKLNDSTAKWRTLKTDHQADFAHSALGMMDAGMDPHVALGITAKLAQSNGIASDDEVQQLLTGAATATPEQIKQTLMGIRGISEKYKDLSKPVVLAGAARPGGSPATLVSPLSGAQIASGAPAGAEPVKPEPGVVYRTPDGVEHPVTVTSDGKFLYNGQDVTSHVTRPTPNDNAAQQAERYIKIQQAQKLGQPVSDADQAWADAYVKQRTIGPEAAAAAATDRQARTIAEQNALQERSQTFQVAQAGRKELTDKVEQPYLDAREKTATLRRFVAAADAGNKVAGSVTPLLATLGLVTSEGVKRINQTEVDQIQGAGSLFDRLRGRVGKLVEGQPVPQDIRDDIKKMADLLEQGARQKYEDSWHAITKRYQLGDEQLLPSPAGNGPNEGDVKPIPGNPGTEITYRGGKWIRTK